MSEAERIISDAMARFGRLPAYLVYRAVYDNLGNHGRNRRVMKTAYMEANRALSALVEQGAVRLVRLDGSGTRVPDDRPRSRWPSVLADNVLVCRAEGYAGAESGDQVYSTALYAWKVMDDYGGAMSPQQLRDGVAEWTGRTQGLSSVVKTLVDNHIAYSVMVGSASRTWAMTVGGREYSRTEEFMESVVRQNE